MTNINDGIIKKKFNNFAFELFDIIAFLVFVIGIMFFVRIFVFTPFSVVGLSMYPMFDDWDFILVDKLSPKLDKIWRWDIVVFVPEGKDIPYIKRVIWLPWETVKLKDWKVDICNNTGCSELKEPYLKSWLETTARCGKSEFKVESWFFVMWDNRWNSTDSRCCFGYWCYEWSTFVAHPKDMLGKVLIRLFPRFTSDFRTLPSKDTK